MRLRVSTQTGSGLTFIELVVVIAVLAILLTLLVASLAKAKQKAEKITCANYQGQIGMAYWIWAGDHGDMFPMEVSVTNGGTMEWVGTSDAWRTYQVMSNELSTPKI